MVKMKEYSIVLEDYWNYKILPENHPFIKAGASNCLNTNQDKLYLYSGINKEFKLLNELFVINTVDFSVDNKIDLNIQCRVNPEMYYWDNSIIIIGGSSYDYSKPMKLFNEIIIIELPDYKMRKIELEKIGLRFTGFLDYENGDLYYTGGLDDDNTIYKINIKTETIEKINFNENTYFSRCGTSSKSFGRKAILFSGFKNYNDIPKCHSDYYIYDFDKKTINWKECNEFIGRTFSKTVLLEKYYSILFVFGSYNGMETSRSIITYDYKKDLFDDLHIQEIPEPVTEGIVFYLESSNKLYIAGGMSHDLDKQKIHEIIWELDIGRIMEKRGITESENSA
jgi:hypothetical protein